MSGISQAKMSRQIREEFNTEKKYADRLIRTECNYFHNQAELMVYREMGVDEYVFMAVLDGRTSQVCQDLDGVKIPLSEAVVQENYPPMHPN